MPTTILLDARALYGMPTGVGSYILYLVEELVSLRQEVRWVALRLKDAGGPSLPCEEVETTLNFHNLVNILGANPLFYRLHKQFKPDIVHSFFHYPPYLWPHPSKLIVTVHDLILTGRLAEEGLGAFSRNRSEKSIDDLIRNFWATASLKQTVTHADAVIHVSDYTRRHSAELAGLGWDPSKQYVVHHGIAPIEKVVPNPDLLEQRLRIRPTDKILLAVGNEKRYKNLLLLVQAWQRLAKTDDSLRLVLVGPSDPLDDLLYGMVPRPDMSRISLTGFIEDSLLQQLYARADLFVFPSLFEGFGFPPLEAMRHGTPTLVANRPPMTEVCGTAVCYFDPHNSDELADAIQRLLASPALQQEYRDKGFEHLSRMTWRKAAEETLAVYDSLLPQR